MSKNTFNAFRIVSYMEGMSYLILVFIAMPMKYLEGHALFLKTIGMIHGILFILFVITLILYGKKFNIEKEIKWDYFIYSLSPFGFILIESAIKEQKWNKMI